MSLKKSLEKYIGAAVGFVLAFFIGLRLLYSLNKDLNDIHHYKRKKRNMIFVIILILQLITIYLLIA